MKKINSLSVMTLAFLFISVVARSADAVSASNATVDCPAERTYQGNVSIKTEGDWKNLDLYCAIDGYLTISNSDARNLSNSSIRHISQTLTIKLNDALGEVAMKNLTSVKGILVWKNGQLREVHFPSLENVGDLLYISKNPLLVVQDLRRSPSDDTRAATLKEKSSHNWFAVSLDKVKNLGGWLVINENGANSRARMPTQNEVATSDTDFVSP